ncbi:hypothetical protein LCGC14_0502990 [marine sediment metagenome]|uniref:Uncharacterized protein n=1 Tax=marine sediment metagenome TaxID=412755 RepID=A0A0F9UQB7_9ZZZZ
MSTLYQRIIELSDTEIAISLLHYLESDISTDGKTKKVLLSEISDLINATIRGAIISEARSYNVNNVNNTNYNILDGDGYNEININPSSANREAKFPDPTLAVNLNRKLKIRNGGNGTHKITLTPFAAETFNVMSGNEEWTLSSFELIQAGDWCEFIGNGTNWIKCNEPYWHKFNNPATGAKVSKTTGWTADQFTPGGFEITFSEAPIGSIAVRDVISQGGTQSTIFYRKSGDTNISNTPSGSSELSHVLMFSDDDVIQGVYWMSSDLKIQIAVTNVNTDVNVQYPIEYLQ